MLRMLRMLRKRREAFFAGSPQKPSSLRAEARRWHLAALPRKIGIGFQGRLSASRHYRCWPAVAVGFAPLSPKSLLARAAGTPCSRPARGLRLSCL
jgi:hypothetical protein